MYVRGKREHLIYELIYKWSTCRRRNQGNIPWDVSQCSACVCESARGGCDESGGKLLSRSADGRRVWNSGNNRAHAQSFACLRIIIIALRIAARDLLFAKCAIGAMQFIRIIVSRK